MLVILLCSIDYNLEAAESNNLLLELLESRDEVLVDQENMKTRANCRHHSLFGLYPLLDRGEAKETRSPISPPTEHRGLRLLVKVSELRYICTVVTVVSVSVCPMLTLVHSWSIIALVQAYLLVYIRQDKIDIVRAYQVPITMYSKRVW